MHNKQGIALFQTQILIFWKCKICISQQNVPEQHFDLNKMPALRYTNFL
jgi:hypothetical protein